MQPQHVPHPVSAFPLSVSLTYETTVLGRLFGYNQLPERHFDATGTTSTRHSKRCESQYIVRKDISSLEFRVLMPRRMRRILRNHRLPASRSPDRNAQLTSAEQ
ncbi:hypothetical protein VTL71DRAFT_8853 [Oculimacula yallundae]|uniref:Uncharacterized protein n=1 Tax=Oculimacula yallundae TaxID=86028 RepID=A0ABR4BUA7_9HELO